MYEGYLEFSGTEIVNAERTEAYVANVGVGLSLKTLFGTDKLHIANEEEVYESPLIDDAPWASDADAAASDFYGLYPLDYTGFGDSTMSSSVTEHLDDGASHGLQRDASRALRVHGLLVGGTRDGAEAGLSWLAEAVRTSNCELDTSCGGGDLRYFITEPDVCASSFTDEEQSDPDSETFGDLSATPVGSEDNSLLTYRWPRDQIDPAMPARVRWSGSAGEGTVFHYGALDRLSMAVLSDSGAIAPLRRNYAINPGMSSSLVGYGFSGAGTMNWAQASSPTPAYAAVVPSAVDGADQLGVVTAPSLSLLPGTYTVSVAVRGDANGSATLTITDPSTTLAGGSALLTSDFARMAVTLVVPPSDVISIHIASSSQIDITQVLVERVTEPLPYFDGDSVSASGDYVSRWLGVSGASVSEKVWTGVAEITRDDSDFRPFLRLTSGTMTNVQLQWWLRTEITMLEQLDPYERTLHEVQCTQGPAVIQRYFTSVGYFIEVDMIFVAGNPHPYSPGQAVSTTPLANLAYSDPDDDADVDDLSWLQDPNQLAVTLPVRAPVVLDPSLRSFTKWQRYYVEIPSSAVQTWGQSVPTIGINSKGSAIKQVRMRFHPNPFEYDPAVVDPTNYCGEVVLSYLPATTRIIIDGITRSAVASKGGKPTIPADHLLYGADGAPVGWPELSCGIPYVLTIDIPADTAIDAFDVDLVIRRRG